MAGFGGFDCGTYPGDSEIQAWKDNSSYQFVGYYLPSPCHPGASWAGKYQLLKNMGWGFAILYVGQQVVGGSCSANTLTRNQGLFDGADTVSKCQTEGFPQGSIVFLDVEGMDPPTPTEMIDYYRGWVSAILDSNYIKPGTYCAAKNANDLFNAAQVEYAAHGLPGGAPSFWIVKVDPLFDPLSSSPTGCGISFADVWQGRIDISNESHGGVTFDIDQDAANTSDPSSASHAALAFARKMSIDYGVVPPVNLVSARATEVFTSVLKDLAQTRSTGEPENRLFFPNGIELIDIEVGVGLKDLGVSVKVIVSGPKRP
jgi:hypothetical protein